MSCVAGRNLRVGITHARDDLKRLIRKVEQGKADKALILPAKQRIEETKKFSAQHNESCPFCVLTVNSK